MKWPKPSIIIKILVSLFLLALLLWLKRETFGEIWNLLRSINIPIFSLAFLVFISSIIFMSWRLRIALAAQKAFFKIKNLCALTFIGYFFNRFEIRHIFLKPWIILTLYDSAGFVLGWDIVESCRISLQEPRPS